MYVLIIALYFLGKSVHILYNSDFSSINCFVGGNHFQVLRNHLSCSILPTKSKATQSVPKGLRKKKILLYSHHIPFLVCFLVRLIIFIKRVTSFPPDLISSPNSFLLHYRYSYTHIPWPHLHLHQCVHPVELPKMTNGRLIFHFWF